MDQASEMQLRAALRAQDYSLTTARRAVFAALHGQEPLTMRELVARCGGVDRASVYRTVTLFERLGIVERLQTGWKYRLELSGGFHEHHHHATCRRCGRSLVMPKDTALEAQLRRLAARLGFRLERHQLELSGVCRVCAAGAQSEQQSKI